MAKPVFPSKFETNRWLLASWLFCLTGCICYPLEYRSDDPSPLAKVLKVQFCMRERAAIDGFVIVRLYDSYLWWRYAAITLSVSKLPYRIQLPSGYQLNIAVPLAVFPLFLYSNFLV